MSRKPDFHRLFIALKPPADLIDELAWLRELTAQGKAEANERLHITMFLFADTPEYNAEAVRLILQALDGQSLPVCRVLFEQVVRNGNTLLLPNDQLEGVFRLQARLAGLLHEPGLRLRPEWHFKPHMTLRRGQASGETLAIDPLSWTAKEIVLLDSHIGLTHHEEIASWPLEGKSP